MQPSNLPFCDAQTIFNHLSIAYLPYPGIYRQALPMYNTIQHTLVEPLP